MYFFTLHKAEKNLNKANGTGKMPQWVNTLAANNEGLNSISRTQTVERKTSSHKLCSDFQRYTVL